MSNKNLDISIYGGKHTGTFSAGSHRYKLDGGYKKGVTTILSATLAKPSLMLWPLEECLKSIGGEKIDGTWTLKADVLLEKGSYLDVHAKAHILKRDKGGDIGTEVHAAIEAFLTHTEVPELSYEARLAYRGFLEWAKQHEIKTVAIERVIFSEMYDYAGTFDALLEIDGKLVLCDWKTSNPSRDAPQGIYADSFVQLGMYAQGWFEEWGNDDKLGNLDDVMILSVKKDGKVDAGYASQYGFTVADCIGMAHNAVGLYSALEKLKIAIKG